MSVKAKTIDGNEEELYRKAMGYPTSAKEIDTTERKLNAYTTQQTIPVENANEQAYDELARRQLSDNDIILERIAKYLPQTLKASGLTGVGGNEKTIYDNVGNALSNRKEIISDYVTRKEEQENKERLAQLENENTLAQRELEIEQQAQESEKNYLDQQVKSIINEINSGRYNKESLDKMYSALLGEGGKDATSQYLSGLNDSYKSSIQSAIEWYVNNNLNSITQNENLENAVSSFRTENNEILSPSLVRGSIREKEGDDFVIKLNGEKYPVEVGTERITKDSDIGERLIARIEEQKSGAKAKEGDVIYYDGTLYAVSKDGNLVSVRARNNFRKDEFNTLLDIYKNATKK